jgi:hypothetical protein
MELLMSTFYAADTLAKTGDKTMTYKFKEPETKDEENIVFEMIEDRGTRAMYRCVSGFEEWQIVPTFVFFKRDMVEVV